MSNTYFAEFLLLYTANFINLVSPGAGATITMRNSYMFGRSAGLLTGAGIVLSSIGHKLISLFGFSWILSHHPVLFYAIKYGGCAFLIYLGFRCFMSGHRLRKTQRMSLAASPGWLSTTAGGPPEGTVIPMEISDTPQAPSNDGSLAFDAQDKDPRVQGTLSKWQAFRIGYVTDLLNPMASIAFLSLVSNTISPSTPRYLLFAYVAILITTSIWWYTTLALLFSNKRLSVWLEKYKALLEYANGSFLVYIGLRIIA